ncbi:hypothetical protein R1flu_026741 [Riccia fluitans]|uniref:Uncharacterized protein n=1 Tax=Riccia fluitans TaxID=41844 RepID=A0ABD1XGT1_9MARC
MRNTRRVIAEGELDGPSSSHRVHDPNDSFTIRHSVPIPQVLGGLSHRLVKAEATIAAREAEQKDEEIAALKKHLQASEQKLQREEAKNAWLHEVTSTLTSEIQSLRSESTKAKLTGKVPDWDWVHEAKQQWKANPSLENMRRLWEALEEHEDQIVVREKCS